MGPSSNTLGRRLGIDGQKGAAMRLRAPETAARGVPTVLALALAVAALTLFLAVDPARAQGGASFTVDKSDVVDIVPGRYIVLLDEDAAQDPEEEAGEDEVEHPGLDVEQIYGEALKGYSAEIPEDEVEDLRKDPKVKSVVPDRVVRAFVQDPPPGVDRIESDQSSTKSGDGAGEVDVGVAVIDTGIDLDHPDLNAYHGTNAITQKKRCAAKSPDASSNDDNGHGSHVAGTIGAKDDDKGVTGVAPGADLYAVKVLDSTGHGSVSDVICGIDWVTANAESKGIKVANMSIGGGGKDDGKSCAKTTDPYKKAICNSVAAGVTYVAAAGNSNKDFKTSVPAAYDEVLTVTAVADFDGRSGGDAAASCSNTDDMRADFSNYTTIGHPDERHTIAAPGVCVESTWKDGAYNTLSGTSMASPHVAGAAALCIHSGVCSDSDGNVAPSEVIARLRGDAAARAKDYGFAKDPHRVTTTGKRYLGYLVYAGSY